jgi:hypothetical protein
MTIVLKWLTSDEIAHTFPLEPATSRKCFSLNVRWLLEVRGEEARSWKGPSLTAFFSRTRERDPPAVQVRWANAPPPFAADAASDLTFLVAPSRSSFLRVRLHHLASPSSLSFLLLPLVSWRSPPRVSPHRSVGLARSWQRASCDGMWGRTKCVSTDTFLASFPAPKVSCFRFLFVKFRRPWT